MFLWPVRVGIGVVDGRLLEITGRAKGRKRDFGVANSQNVFGHRFSYGRRWLEACTVAAENGVEIFKAWHRSEQGRQVGADGKNSRPAPSIACLLHDRHAIRNLLRYLLDKAGIGIWLKAIRVDTRLHRAAAHER